MANIFQTEGPKLARTAAALVGSDLKLAALVNRDLAADFSTAGVGDTVKVAVPGAIATQTRGIGDTSTPLVSGDISEQTIDVTLSTHAYNDVVLSEQDLSLEIKDFTRQVLVPQADSIVKYAERTLASAMQATPEASGLAYDPASPASTFTQMRRELRSNGVPAEAKLMAAVGAGVYADLLDSEAIDDNGRVRGFEIHENTRLADDEIIGFIRDSFILIVRAPAVPAGASYGASVTEGGFALRHLQNYDSSVAVDRSLVSAFIGAQAMPLCVDNEDGTVSLVENGGCVRVLTSTAAV